MKNSFITIRLSNKRKKKQVIIIKKLIIFLERGEINKLKLKKKEKLYNTHPQRHVIIMIIL